MARTQLDERGIANKVITGTSFRDEMKIYDETKAYLQGDRVIWQNNWWEALGSITPTSEGNLTSAPDINTAGWKKVEPPVFSVHPSVSQTFDNSARTIINFNTIDTPDDSFSLNGPEIVVQSTGTFIITATITTLNTTSNRDSSYVYFQLDTGSGFADIPDVKMTLYNRGYSDGEMTGTYILPYTFNFGDKIRFQVIGRTADSQSTVTAGCRVNVFAAQSVSGPKGDKGDKGDTGQPGDVIWRGPYNSSTTYNDNDAVEYLGTSYVSIVNNNAETPSDTATNWDILAKKGADGSGAQINIADEGVNIPNTPHGTLNFHGGFDVTDQGGGTAGIGLIKNSIASCTNGASQTFANVAISVNLANSINTTEVSINETTGIITINEFGTYRIWYKTTVSNTTSTRSNPHVYFELNGATFFESTVHMYSRNTTSGNATAFYTIPKFLNQGDEIQFFVANDVNANLTLNTGESFFYIERLNDTAY